MAGIKQTIPNYGVGGISEQPDELKYPGQVRDIVNGMPTPVHGLQKRPGAKRIGSDDQYPNDRIFSIQPTQADKDESKRLATLNNVPEQGKWFHYYRDETEGSYIGQIDPDGFVRIWSCKDGVEKNVWYHAKGTGAEGTSNANNSNTVDISSLNGFGSKTNYNSDCQEHTMIASISNPVREGADAVSTRPSSAAWVSVDQNLRYLSGWVKQADNSYKYVPENIQTLTINDTTFVSNSNVAVRIGNNSSYTADDYHWAYVELLRTENGRQYGLNISDNNDADTEISSVTNIKLLSDDLSEGPKTGHCPGIGTQVFGPINSDDFPFDKTADGVTSLYDNGDADEENYKEFIQIKIKGPNTGGMGASAASGHIYNNDQKYNETKNENGSEWNDGYHLNGSIIGPHTEAKYPTEKRRNLYCRITTNGQQGRVSTTNSNNNEPDKFECSYNREVNLLFGGEGYKKGDRIRVQMSSAKGGRVSVDGSGNDDSMFRHPPRYILEVKDVEVSKCKANIRAIRPAPTPFDSDIAVSAETILGGILGNVNSDHELLYDVYTSSGGSSSSHPTLTTTPTKILAGGQPLKGKRIGNGIYFWCNKPFDVEVVEKDLMRVTTGEVKSVGDLPLQCRHGAIVKVINADNAGEDDFYMKFKGTNDLDGTGIWKECVAPSIKYYGSDAQFKEANGGNNNSGDPYVDFHHTDPTRVTWPHIIQRQADGDFLVKRFDWEKREVGDHLTNPFPSFISTEGNGFYPSMRNWYSDQFKETGKPKYYQESTAKFINKVVFFRNRLVFLSGENVVCSRPGTMAKPNFWSNTALTISAIDPIDIAASSQYPSSLFDAIEVPAGLLVFSSNSQFLLEADDNSFTTETAKLRNISNYNYNVNVSPVSLGTTVAFLDNSNKFTRVSELSNIGREQEAVISDNSLLVPSLLAQDLNLLCNSRENNLVFISKKPTISTGQGVDNSKITDGTNIIYGYKYVLDQQNNKIPSWFRWQFKNNIKYMFIVDDDLFFLDTDNFLQKINLVEDTEDLSVNAARSTNSIHYPYHLDNWVEMTRKGTYDPITNITTFKDFPALLKVTDPGTDLVLLNKGNGNWAPCTFTGNVDTNVNTFTIPGNWSGIFTGWNITNQGEGYTSAPTVAIVAPGGTLAGNIEAGKKTIINATNLTHYSTGSKITSIASGGGSVTLPAGGATIMKIYNNEITLDTAFGGSGSATGATLNWQCPGEGATITPIITDGKLTDFELVEQGWNYSVAPTITVTGGDGSNAAVVGQAGRILTAGYLFEMDVEFPTIYPIQGGSLSQQPKATVNGNLTLHRVNFNFGKVGTYETTLTRVGKDTYTDVHESRPSNLYEVSDVPYLESDTQTVPVYERNKNVKISLKSKYPSPATLNSLTWEGDFSPRNYSRV